MTYKSVGKPVRITPENMERFAEVASRPQPQVRPTEDNNLIYMPNLRALRRHKVNNDGTVELTIRLTEKDYESLERVASWVSEDAIGYASAAVLERVAADADLAPVLRVEARPGKRLELWFADGFHGVRDLHRHLSWERLAPLADADEFASITMRDGGVAWPCGAAMGPRELRDGCESLDGGWGEKPEKEAPHARTSFVQRQTIEEVIQDQDYDHEYQQWLSEEYPEKARAEALRRLMSAGIVDENGELTPRYRH